MSIRVARWDQLRPLSIGGARRGLLSRQQPPIGKGSIGMVFPGLWNVTILDDFNDGDISDWSGNLIYFQALTTRKVEGAYALTNKVKSMGIIYREGALTQQGDRLGFFICPMNGAPDEPVIRFAWGRQDDTNFYAFELNFNSNYMRLIRRLTTGYTYLAGEGFTYNAGRWYHVTVDWDTSGNMVCQFNHHLVTGNATEFSSGGYHVQRYTNDTVGSWYIDYIYRIPDYNA